MEEDVGLITYSDGFSNHGAISKGQSCVKNVLTHRLHIEGKFQSQIVAAASVNQTHKLNCEIKRKVLHKFAAHLRVLSFCPSLLFLYYFQYPQFNAQGVIIQSHIALRCTKGPTQFETPPSILLTVTLITPK